ncbi:MAG: carboxymuconolactone decarboxylase family protein [Acidimicrobiia bacterium]
MPIDQRRPHLLDEAPAPPEAEALFEQDLANAGYVMNLTRLWAHEPAAKTGWFEVIKTVTRAGELSMRQQGILVTATAATLGDSYCSLAWGKKLAAEADPEIATGVLLAKDQDLTESEQVMARWARKVTRDPNSTDRSDVDALRAVGFSDRQIFAMTVYISLRIAFSTVNDALGALPDSEYRANAPSEVLDAVTWGRPIDT